MKSFKNFELSANTKHRLKRCVSALAIVFTAGLIPILAAKAEGPAPFRFSLVPASATIQACLPDASAAVTVLPGEDSRGVDTLDLKAEGLPPHTGFSVFLTESAVSVGAVQYIGDFTTNAAGRGSMRVDTIVNEAFSSTIVNGARVRTDLNHIVMWFSDPGADDFCFAPATGPVTPFDGDNQAGAAALSSQNFLPNAPLP
jgi:hypothetical protein